MTGTVELDIRRYRKGHAPTQQQDSLIEETPLEIWIAYTHNGRRHRTRLAATMRTPGDDLHLVAGWMFAEGMIQQPNDLLQIRHIDNTDTVLAELAPHVRFDPAAQQRQFPISSACGWCGRHADRGEIPTVLPNNLRVPAGLINMLPGVLRAGQGLFSATGGAHATALVDAQGELLLRCEDVGRHNAMDKLIGAMWQKGQLPLSQHIAVFSGRFGYELAQKSLAAGIQIACSIGAPSSAAIELADAYGMTVCGFVREESFNVYCGASRIDESLDWK